MPYGTVEPWWKAAFVCAVFAICIIALIETLKKPLERIEGASVLLPMLALSLVALLQTLSLGSRTEAELSVWNTISADPYQTRFFALQMLALTVLLALLYRYASTEGRVRVLVYTVLAIAVASAVFGILRQTTQQETGFLLPLLKQNQGYGQFINKNWRWSRTRATDDLPRSAVAGLDRTRIGEFAWWDSGNARAGCCCGFADHFAW